jgi:hypothetical protein
MSLRETGSLVAAFLKADLKVRLFDTTTSEPRFARLSWVYGFAPDTPPLAVAPLKIATVITAA